MMGGSTQKPSAVCRRTYMSLCPLAQGCDGPELYTMSTCPVLRIRKTRTRTSDNPHSVRQQFGPQYVIAARRWLRQSLSHGVRQGGRPPPADGSGPRPPCECATPAPQPAPAPPADDMSQIAVHGRVRQASLWAWITHPSNTLDTLAACCPRDGRGGVCTGLRPKRLSCGTEPGLVVY